MDANTKAVLTVARQQQTDDIIVLSTGYRARIVPVAPTLLQQVSAQFKEPPVPTWHNPDKGRDEPNPNDPDYLRTVQEVNEQRGLAVMDALILFGVELVDPIPEDGWENKLRYLGIEVDTNDPLARELAFKKYVAVGNADLMEITRRAGITEEAVQEAAQMFRRQQTRTAN